MFSKVIERLEKSNTRMNTTHPKNKSIKVKPSNIKQMNTLQSIRSELREHITVEYLEI